MKFTHAWLKEFLESNATLDEISQRLTALGLEVESITDRSQELAPFIVAEILEANPHPDATKLQVCRVNNGTEELQIVCGAPNARAGIKVVLAPIGSTIPAHGLVIKASKIRGVESNGMLCSARELVVGDDESGIIELPASAIPGSSFAALSGLDDPVIEIAITPNRGDCLGVYGIARDLAASGLGKLKPLALPHIKSNTTSPISVAIADTSACPLFAGRYIKNVTNRPSPDWLQNLLKAVGIKPISALVDITNYIAFTYGRPLHVYDAATLQGNITVRSAQEGEIFEALGGKSYSLKPRMTVISDEAQVLALGGIIGGNSSGCTETTRDVFLESALFNPANIADTGRQLLIDTDSRYRFERNVDPAFIVSGADLATQLIIDTCGGETSELVIAGSTQNPVQTQSFNLERILTLGGLQLDNNTVMTILTALGFTIKGNNITVPSWRSDVDCEASLVEEVLRVYGYDNLPALPLPLPEKSQPAYSPQQRRTATSRRLLAMRGMTEAVTWSFMPTPKAILFNGGSDALKLQNPISVELESMRPSLLPNLLDALARNSARGFHDLALFEIGPEFHGIKPNQQRIMITGVRAGKTAAKSHYNDARDVDALDAKADCLAVLAESGVPVDRVTIAANAPAWYHPGRSGTIALGGKNILAHFGELHPLILKEFDLKGAVVGFEIAAEAIPLSKPKQGRKPAPEYSDYQAVVRDFAFIVGSDVPVDSILRAARAADKVLITNVALFDVYSGKGVEEGKKSVALSVTLQSNVKTLTEEELDAVSRKVIAEVEKQTGGALRA
jgi:phenylalanyl-tRNA synthetase beta chain